MKTVRFQQQLHRQFSLEELEPDQEEEDEDGTDQGALVFDKGHAVHPINRKLTVHIHGFFLLTLPLGAFPKIPEYEMDGFDSMLRHWGTENNLLDSRLEFNVLTWYPSKAVFLLAPALKPWNKKLKILLKGLLWWRIVDQFFSDSLTNSLLGKDHFADFSKFLGNIMIGLYRDVEGIPNIDIPFLNHALSAFFNLYIDIKESVAGYENNHQYLLAELLNWIQSYKIRVLYKRSTRDELQEANYMFKKLCGKRSIVELIQLLTATYVDRTVRDNLLFKIFCNSGDLIQTMAQDVFLLPKDVLVHDNSLNLVLRNMQKRGMNFDEALEIHMAAVNNETLAFKKYAEALEAEFPTSEQIHKFVHNYQCYVDGFIRTFATQIRYGRCEFKIMKVVPTQGKTD